MNTSFFVSLDKKALYHNIEYLREGPFFFLGGEKKILLSITFRRDPLEKSLKVFKNFFIFYNKIWSFI